MPNGLAFQLGVCPNVVAEAFPESDIRRSTVDSRAKTTTHAHTDKVAIFETLAIIANHCRRRT